MSEELIHDVCKRLFTSALLWVTAVGIIWLTGREPAVISVSSNTDGQEVPIYCVETEKKQVALTFDAAWGNDMTDRILKILKKNRIHATFFVTGIWAANFPEDVKKILRAGHDIGNHSMNHKNMSELTEAAVKEEVLETHELVKRIAGYEMKLFRMPYGEYNNRVLKQIRKLHYYPIQWDVDSQDWKDYGAGEIVRLVCGSDNLGGGSIIWMHHGASYTADALQEVIDGLQAQGYEIVPVSELIYYENYHMDSAGRQIENNK